MTLRLTLGASLLLAAGVATGAERGSDNAAAGPGPPAEVNAAGNFLTGGLAFEPADVSVEVGGVVRWRNTDFLVPHTATEDHELWDLGGSYGATPASASGFGPGETAERPFAAGTWNYFCRVHPDAMIGTVSVPVSLRQGGQADRVIVRWGSEALPAGQLFDVQRRRADGPWQIVSWGTTATAGRFGAHPGSVVAFRARVRASDDRARSSGYSPPADLKLR